MVACAYKAGIDMSSQLAPYLRGPYGWTIKVHPYGCRYFYSPGIVTDLELARHAPSDGTFKCSLNDDDYDYEEYFMQPAAGDMLEKVYINHALGYASSFKWGEWIGSAER
jgi:hypothetical protein